MINKPFMKLILPFILVFLPTSMVKGSGETENSHITPLYHYSEIHNTQPDPEPVSMPILEPLPEPVVEPKGHWIRALVTAYSPHVKSCGKWSRIGITSDGTNVRSGDPNDSYGYAVDPKMIPYGTKIYIPEYWDMISNNKNHIPSDIPIADDTGGAMRHSAKSGVVHIDVRFRLQSTAQKWGSRWLDVFIYE